MSKALVSNKIAKTLGILSLAVLLMGNESCPQNSEVMGKRQLKRSLELGKIKAQPFENEKGQTFDIQYFLNEQIYDVVNNSNDFVINFRPDVQFEDEPSLLFSSKAEQEGYAVWKKAQNAMERAVANNHESGESRFIETPQGLQKAFASTTASCMVYLPRHRLQGQVYSFEFTDSNEISLGYKNLQTQIGIGFNYEVKNTKMDMDMTAYDSMYYEWNKREEQRRNASVIANHQEVQSSGGGGFNISFLFISLGFNRYYSEAISKVTRDALTNNLKKLLDRILQNDKKWYTRAIALDDDDKTLHIIGGRNMKLKEKDLLDVYNTEYLWENGNNQSEACSPKSAYLGDSNARLVGTIELTYVGEVNSTGVFLKESDWRPEVGARVYLNTLAEDRKDLPENQNSGQQKGSVQRDK